MFVVDLWVCYLCFVCGLLVIGLLLFGVYGCDSLLVGDLLLLFEWWFVEWFVLSCADCLSLVCVFGVAMLFGRVCCVDCG